MTYLELVQSVLKRLRENSNITSVNNNTYSQLIGELVSDAKSEVEQAWSWSALRTTISGTTQANVFNYELNGSVKLLHYSMR